jgi:Permuted papain-like amidase enzyme, YaeF/YiiX, C92 family
MKRLISSILQRGDIILTTTTEPVSKAIRAGTKSDISHAMICVEHSSVIDATSDGVHARNTQRLFFDDQCSLHVFRLKSGLSAEQAKAVCQFVRQRVGSEYSVKEAIRTVIGGSDQWTRKQFCSRLVAQAYAHAGIKLIGDPNYCSPADLAKSPLVAAVQDATETVTLEEAARWAAHTDTTQAMRDATNSVLQGVRKKNKAIQTFEDVIAHLIRHPEDDPYVLDLLSSSGYLTVWQINTDKNQWQYDDELIGLIPRGDCEEYCLRTFKDEEAGPNRYIVNRGQLASLSKRFGLASFERLLELYDLLAALHRQRVAVATRWLETNSLISLQIDTALTPHSPEWFAAQELWDPPKAAQTKYIIEAEGRRDICSVCGDDPAQDYRLAEPFRPPGGADTLRLCEDCLVIRRASGDPFEPME